MVEALYFITVKTLAMLEWRLGTIAIGNTKAIHYTLTCFYIMSDWYTSPTNSVFIGGSFGTYEGLLFDTSRRSAFGSMKATV